MGVFIDKEGMDAAGINDKGNNAYSDIMMYDYY
jgi:hypothetical protein